MGGPINVFISYACEDEDLRKQLAEHLAPMEREGILCVWHAARVAAGEHGAAIVEQRFMAAQVILLLTSSSYFGSDYLCVEMRRSLELAEKGTARVIPVVLRACDLEMTPLRALSRLPRNGIAVTSWSNRDEAFDDVVRGLRGALADPPRTDATGTTTRKAFEPIYDDAESRALCDRLEQADGRRQVLLSVGEGTADVDTEILGLRRQLREGGQLHAGDELEKGRYLLLERIGRGGFGSVWRARDRQHEEYVAIKVLHPDQARDASRRERFLRGARLMATLQHPVTVALLAPAGEDGKFHYFVMELLEGGDLRRAVLEGRIAPNDVVPLILEVGGALEEAHARGIIHRDVKPANILLDTVGRPRLTDFDLATASDTTGGTRTGGMGTYPFGAPEQLHDAKSAGPPADIHALAMTAVFCLFGREFSAFVGRQPERVIVELPCGEAVKRELLRAIAVEPGDRHASIAAFCEALVTASSTPPAGDENIWRRRGSEVQAADWAAGKTRRLTRADAAALLAEHLEPDLPDHEDAREVALDWAADEYARGLRQMRATRPRGPRRSNPAHRPSRRTSFQSSAGSPTNRGTMSISEEIREAVRAAKAASETRADDPFKRVLDEVAHGLSGDGVEARVSPAPAGKWTLRMAPADRPGRSVAVVQVVISAGRAEVLLDVKQVADEPAQLAGILKKLVTTPAFLESLAELAALATQPVESFLKMAPRTVSREDLMLEVPPGVQREIAGSIGKDISLRLRIADFRGAGTFKAGTAYKVLESAGLSVALSQEVTQDGDGALRLAGRVSLTAAP